jgi:hypothetical protein
MRHISQIACFNKVHLEGFLVSHICNLNGVAPGGANVGSGLCGERTKNDPNLV